MKTNRILTIAVVLLLLVNLTMLFFMVRGRGHHDMKKGGGPFDMMVKELNMTEQQQANFKKLKDDHFAAINPIFDSVKTLKRSLFGLVKEEHINDSMIANYSRLIAEQRAMADILTINHFRKVRGMFSGDQQNKFDDFIQKMMQRRMSSPGNHNSDSTKKED